MFEKILVICVGNICRSPMAEKALQQKLPGKTIASAGLASEKSHLVGKPADPMAIELASTKGLDLSQHQSRQLTPALCQEYDLLLVMERGHIEALTRIAPAARGKTMLLGEWVGKKEVPDPYQLSQEAFEHAFNIIESATTEWAKKLAN